MAEKEREFMQQRTDTSAPNVPQGQNTGQNYSSIYPTVPGPVVNPAYPVGTLTSIPREKKSIIEAYLLWLIFGLLGAHHFYLRRTEFGIVYFFTFGLLGCGWLIDMFRMPYLVSETNKKVMDAFQVKKKNISDAYTLWFPFGLLGFHHFYLGNVIMGILYFFTLGLFGIGWLIDLVRIPYMVKAANERDPFVRQEKSVGLAYVLGVSPFGLLGFHHFYLNRPLWGFIYFFTFGLLGVGYLVDWFRIPVLVKRANKEIKVGPDYDKHLDDAYVLWFPFGLIGLHHFYLNRPVWGFIYFFTFGLLGVGWLVDGCRMSCLVKDCNRRTKERLERLPVYQVPYAGVVITNANGPNLPQGTAPPGYDNPGYGAPYPTQQPVGYQYPPSAGYMYQQQPGSEPVPSYMEQPPPYTPEGGAASHISGSEKAGHI